MAINLKYYGETEISLLLIFNHYISIFVNDAFCDLVDGLKILTH